jgi:hypothetical protein
MFSLIKAGADNIDTIPENSSLVGQLGKGRLNIYNSLNKAGEPFIEITGFSLKDLNDSIFTHSDTFLIHLSFANHLDNANNITLKIHSDSLIKCIGDSEYVAGTMLYGDTITMATPFQFGIKKQLGYDANITLPVEIYENNQLINKDYIRFNINATYINVRVNNVHFTVTSNGAIGYNKFNRQQGIGIGTKNSESQVWEASFMIGRNNKVSDNARDSLASNSDSDFKIIQPVSVFQTPDYWVVNAWFNDSLSENPIGVKVHQIVSVTDKPGHENYVLYKYVVYNENTFTLTGLAAGIFADWDINDFTNTAVVHESRRLGYVYDADNSYPYCAIQQLKPLGGGFKVYSVANNGSENNGINLYDGYSDYEKFYVLTNNAFTAGLNQPKDVSQSVSYAGFDILPGDSLEIVFAIHLAYDLQNLMQSADSAYFLLNGQLPLSVLNNQLPDNGYVYPNPAKNKIFIQNNKNIQVVKVLGIDGKKLHQIRLPQTDTVVELDISHWAKGIYFLQITDEDNISKMWKVVKQ